MGSGKIKTETMNRLLLIILDGFGLSFDAKTNPVLSARTPTLDGLIANYPFTALQASGEEVGLSWGEVGNSEVGHFNLGSGIILWQNLPKIDQKIVSGEFFKNKVLIETCQKVKKNNSSLHLVGLVSDGGIHSHIRHLFALLKIAKDQSLEKVYVHMISDGRDTPPKAASDFINQLQAQFDAIGTGQLSTIAGRFWAMDRDDNWDRIKKWYQVVIGKSQDRFKAPLEAINHFYSKGQDDEKLKPSIIDLESESQFIRDSDGVIIFNFRADRAREMARAIGDPNLIDFSREYFAQNLSLATMTPYETDWKMDINVVFQPPQSLYPSSLLISDQNLSQYHTSESEKKAHVTYFFNGGNDQTYPQETDKIFASPEVESYDQQPEMNLPQVTENLVKVIKNENYNFILLNMANPDMVGHTGKFKAARLALEAVDSNLELLLKAASAAGYTVLITADHGNIEQMINPATGKPDKEHTINPVPFFWVDRYRSPTKALDSERLWQEICQLNPSGVLADVTATVLNQLEVPVPEFITGEELSKALVKL